MPRYKHGKRTAPIDFETFRDRMENCRWRRQGLDPKDVLSHKSFVAFLYWFGVRKSEALNMQISDFSFKDTLLIADISPKKHGSREPLEVPMIYPFVDLIVKRILEVEEGRLWKFSDRTAINIVKRVMGDQFYPHFFRLNRATRFLEDPTTTVPEMKAWFGWRSAKSIDPYIGYSRRHIRRQRERLKNELS